MNNRITKLAGRKKMRVVGLMSGTSADGVDAAIVDIDGRGVHLLAFDVYRYPSALRTQILKLAQPETARLDQVCHYNFVLGEKFADAVIKLCRRSRIAVGSIDLVGSHGHTIYHNPEGTLYANMRIRSTLQIGEPSVIAQRTGITTVADFRPRDMAANGQGAPLVPYADYVLFGHRHLCRAIQNIGGIANVTYLPANGEQRSVIAFDSGPGNMIIDRLASLVTHGRRRFDLDGKLASRGEVDRALLNEMLGHPFLRRRPPKSTGREHFGFAYVDRLYHKAVDRSLAAEEILATATAFTATTIAQAYNRFLPTMPDQVILCGGGAHNLALVEMLRRRLSDVEILTTNELGIDVDAKEAVSFAILAWATIRARANNVPGATGADQTVILGKIVPGK
ncbi:MAG: anhydro-N-acetylmuramic acid kinase [Phycisphaerales bacterium]|nr:MAG: anhydro-N-acetylmuramic acid kinase [Phycisphaerales bacterium]